jgi:hypothetical protein
MTTRSFNITCGPGEERRNSTNDRFTRPVEAGSLQQERNSDLPRRTAMLPTVTIESTRVFSTFQMELLLASVIVVAAVAWMALTHMRHHRHR